MIQTVLRDAPSVWKLLKGVICIFKPAGVSPLGVRRMLVSKLADELNELKCREPIPYVTIEGDTTKNLSISVRPSFSDHPLVVGPRYQAEDIKCYPISRLGFNTSGVLLAGLNSGIAEAVELRDSLTIRTYKIYGELGYSTDTNFKTGKVIERSKYDRIYRGMIDKWCASIQASHQSKMFEFSGVNLQSQEAYDLAVKGLIRPKMKEVLIYNLKCTEFKPPYFTIEVQCVNEFEEYLTLLIHEIGYKLHSNATCIGIKCIRHTLFTINDALLLKHVKLEHVIDNLSNCRSILGKYSDSFNSPHLVNIDRNEIATTQQQ
ncbi:hypothetical protein LSTR_LSTR002480 [Laodelphax striatellus]|uniref:Pseudouridine synthase II N-terminal domain-containing protein n=1 Tax=Laodelphax striatellus TaxID=195883 RepID=A0A482X2G3_LAOST|nr:hypothetical protein LSTR_LSTR002480 [Laodelphax striatellus]